MKITCLKYLNKKIKKQTKNKIKHTEEKLKTKLSWNETKCS